MSKHMKWIVVMMIIAVFGFAGIGSVSAAEKSVSGSGGKVTLKTAAVQNTEPEYMPNAVLVMFKQTKQQTKKGAQKKLTLEEDTAEDIEIEELWNFETDPLTVTSDSGIRKTLLKGSSKGRSYSTIALITSKKLTTKQLLRKMKQRDDVLYAEPNYRVHACGVDDPYFRYQWSMQGGSAGSPAYNPATSNVESVWDQGITGTDRIVAVVDTGVDYTHPDLMNNMWYNTHQRTLKGEYGFDFIDGDDDPMDENGHGTHCAGIIGAQGNNGIGTVGVNQSVKIMAMRTLDADGSSWMSHEVAAYNYISKAQDLGEPVQAINNSWAGGEYSDIFAELIDIVGKKGAVTVCAAGNDGANNDEYEDYPACIDSPYLISVAATTRDGKLASFSNYGLETVDMAAPGTDTLSTVCYDTYNPSIYGSDQNSISAAYNNYDPDNGSIGGISTLRNNLYLNGEKYASGSGKPQISIESSNGGFQQDDGHAAEINLKKMRAGDLICITIPYELSQNTVTAPAFSAMMQNGGNKEEGAIVGVLDVEQGSDLSINTIGDIYLGDAAYSRKGDPDYWRHFWYETLSEDGLAELKEEAREAAEEAAKAGEPLEFDPLKREIVLVMYAYEPCNLKVRLDDMGMSRQDLASTEVFGKYEYMNGTSMATPHISGAVALKAAADGTALDENGSKALITEITSMARDDDIPVIAGGSFDFTRKPVELAPRISDIKVDTAGGKIIITGTGLNPSTGVTVQVGPAEDQLQTAQILSQSDKEIAIKDNGWINNEEIVRVTGYGGKTASRSYIYLVNGKKQFKVIENAEDETTLESFATDGKKIYNLDSNNETIWKITPSSGNRKRLAKIDPASVFGSKAGSNPLATYAMQFGRDLVYMKGKLYTVVEYGEADMAEGEYEEDWSLRKGGTKKPSDEEVVIWLDDDEEEGTMAIYSSELRLISVDVKTGKVKNLGRLPKALETSEDFAMAAYKNKLYFMGGYSFEDRALTDQVKVYNPAKKKKNKRWSNGPKLPDVRSGGKAMASGGKLIYTLGYNQPIDADYIENYRFPANLVFDGKKWTVSATAGDKGIEPLYMSGIVIRGGKMYPDITADVSAVKGGLVYLGLPAASLGDAFFYKTASDRFVDSGINFIQTLYDYEIHGIAVGKKLYGFDGESVYRVKMK